MNIKPFNYIVTAHGYGSHASTSETRYDAIKNMRSYIISRGINIQGIKITANKVRQWKPTT